MSPFVKITLSALLATGALFLTGCDRKEKVIDIETPGGSLEVERDKDTGEVDIEAEEKD